MIITYIILSRRVWCKHLEWNGKGKWNAILVLECKTGGVLGAL